MLAPLKARSWRLLRLSAYWTWGAALFSHRDYEGYQNNGLARGRGLLSSQSSSTFIIPKASCKVLTPEIHMSLCM